MRLRLITLHNRFFARPPCYSGLSILWSAVLESSAVVIAIFEFVLLLFSLCVHECAHAWTASRLGDNTAREMGRMTLNPTEHIDPIGTLLYPAVAIFGPFIGFTFLSGLVLFGWAKPTPVLARNFNKIVRDDNLVALAGPTANLLLAFVAFAGMVVLELTIRDGRNVVPATLLASIFRHGEVETNPIVLLCTGALVVNLSLLIFHLLPIPPLDGGRLLRNLLPYNAVQAYDRIPIWVSYLLLLVFGGAIMRALFVPMLALVLWMLIHI